MSAPVLGRGLVTMKCSVRKEGLRFEMISIDQAPAIYDILEDFSFHAI